jgi:hypothetical protein
MFLQLLHYEFPYIGGKFVVLFLSVYSTFIYRDNHVPTSSLDMQKGRVEVPF